MYCISGTPVQLSWLCISHSGLSVVMQLLCSHAQRSSRGSVWSLCGLKRPSNTREMWNKLIPLTDYNYKVFLTQNRGTHPLMTTWGFNCTYLLFTFLWHWAHSLLMLRSSRIGITVSSFAWHLHDLRQPRHSFVTSGCRYITKCTDSLIYSSIFGMSKQWNMLCLVGTGKVFPHTYILLHCSLKRMSWVE